MIYSTIAMIFSIYHDTYLQWRHLNVKRSQLVGCIYANMGGYSQDQHGRRRTNISCWNFILFRKMCIRTHNQLVPSAHKCRSSFWNCRLGTENQVRRGSSNELDKSKHWTTYISRERVSLHVWIYQELFFAVYNARCNDHWGNWSLTHKPF